MVVWIPWEETDQARTVYRIDLGDVSVRTAKKKLRIVLKEWNVPTFLMKKVIKELFPNGNTKGKTPTP